jgi:hypothetical protein
MSAQAGVPHRFPVCAITVQVSLVHRERQTNLMLDPSGNAEIKRELEECKHHLHQMMQQDVDLRSVHIIIIIIIIMMVIDLPPRSNASWRSASTTCT